MSGCYIGHAGRIELHHVAAVGHKGNGSGDNLLIDERLHPPRDLRQNFLIHAGCFSAGLATRREPCRADGNKHQKNQ